MRITNHIHLLKIPFKITISPEIQIDRFVNLFIIEGKGITLVDTGVAGTEEIIFNYLRNIGRKPEEIKNVLLTHTHPDHIGSVKTIKEQTKCKVWVHADEKAWVEDTELQFRERPVPGFHNLVAGSCKVDYLLRDDEILDLDDDTTIKVIHCPGHSAGSVAFLHQQDNVLISGDAIPVKNDVPIYDDFQVSIKSLEKLENIPYTEYLLSSWDDHKQGDEVEIAISDGFEVLYSVHQAFAAVVTPENKTDLQGITKLVLESMSLPSEIVNPLFARALKSHFSLLK